MSRPLRIEYAGAVYHVMSHGNDKRSIFADDLDRERFLLQLKECSENYKVEVLSYVLMSNYYHFLLKTREANLSKFMQWMNVDLKEYKQKGMVAHGRSTNDIAEYLAREYDTSGRAFV